MISEAELQQEMGDVALDGALADYQLPGDLSIQEPTGDEVAHLTVSPTGVKAEFDKPLFACS